MKVIQYLLCILSVYAFCSCQKEKQSPLNGCCEMPSISEAFGNARVYIPNIFTPDQDGINDFLFVAGDSVARVISLSIFQNEDELVYHLEDFPMSDGHLLWDGKVNGEFQKTVYSLSITLEAEDGTIADFETQVCSYPCELVEEDEKATYNNCHFPIQAYHAQHNPNITTGESPGCFK